jgi:hypothetical protein
MVVNTKVLLILPVTRLIFPPLTNVSSHSLAGSLNKQILIRLIGLDQDQNNACNAMIFGFFFFFAPVTTKGAKESKVKTRAKFLKSIVSLHNKYNVLLNVSSRPFTKRKQRKKISH